jgi:hypothetical protein
MSIEAVKHLNYKDPVNLAGVVVVAVDDEWQGTGCWNSEFWVVDPAAPTTGIYVYKRCIDTPVDLQVKVGDVLDITGTFNTMFPYFNMVGYRYTVLNASSTAPMALTPKGTQVPPSDNVTSAGFGFSDGGRVLANPELSGTRIHIPGPLYITNPNPPALMRLSALGAADSKGYGFEVTGGILVNNYKTYGPSPTDGGRARCDFRARENDGGPGTVAFPSGLSGVWDSYTFTRCKDGGDPYSCSANQGTLNGYVPGTAGSFSGDGGYARYTFVVYPQDCENDFAGATGL